MASGRVERNLIIRLEGHMDCKTRVERIKTRYNEITGMSGSESNSSLSGQKYRDELLKEMACRFVLGRIKPDVIAALVKAEKTMGR